MTHSRKGASELGRFYALLDRLAAGTGGWRPLGGLTKADVPASGVYFFGEAGETRAWSDGPRVVRVGTHAISSGSAATLWSRLRAHRGSGNLRGNHRGSIFRLHVGLALAAAEPVLAVASWGQGQSASAETRQAEAGLEMQVSEFTRALPVVCLAVDGPAGKESDRAYLERNAIALLSRPGLAVRSPGWLGRLARAREIRESGLWNVQHVGRESDPDFLDVFEAYVEGTLGTRPMPVPFRPAA